MARKLVSSGSSFEADIGYSRAVVEGDWIFVSGTTGFDYATMTVSDDVVAQCEQSMRNIAAELSQAGASMTACSWIQLCPIHRATTKARCCAIAT